MNDKEKFEWTMRGLTAFVIVLFVVYATFCAAPGDPWGDPGRDIIGGR